MSCIHRQRFGLSLAAAGVSILLAACGQPAAEGTAAPAASELPADVAAVARELAAPQAPAAEAAPAAGPERITATGELVSPVRSEIVARWPGRVGTVMVEEGDAVRRGQPLLRLETQYLEPEKDRAEAEKARAEAARAEAETDFRRKEELLSRGSIPQALFDRSKGAYEQAKAAVAAAEAAAALARQRLEDALMTSPIDGVVAERRVDPGERLGDNTVAFVLSQVVPLKLRFSLPERHLREVAAGREVRATFDPYPGETFTGKVVMTGKVVDSATRTFAVEAELPNRDRRLQPGLFARVELAPAGREGG